MCAKLEQPTFSVPSALSKEAESSMAGKRDQEDVFKPLNEPPSEPDEPQAAGRGWEIKVGLAALVLLFAVVGYFGYSLMTSAGEDDQTAEDSSPLEKEKEIDPLASGAVVPAVAEPEVEATARLTDWTEVSQPSDTGQEEEGTTLRADVEPSLAAVPSQSYAANYGPDHASPTDPSSETTFAPAPSPDPMAPLAAAPLPAESGAMASDLTQSNQYAMPAANAGSTVLAPGYGSAPQTDYSPSPVQQPQSLAQPQQSSWNGNPAGASQDLTASPQQSADAMSAWKSPVPAPIAPAYASPAPTQSTEDYSASTQSYPPSTSDNSSTLRNSYSGSSASPYGQASTVPSPLQNTYGAYEPSNASRTQAGYAGLSSAHTSNETAAPNAWQQPTAVPVDGNYTAQPNDNFYTIAKKVYGSGAYYKALAMHNKDKYPKANQIRIGDVVQTPSAETLESRYPELCPRPEHRDAAKQRSSAAAGRSLAGRRVYVVQEGDSLFDIARFELGARARVAELIELNRDVLGDQINYLTPGMRLVLPETEQRGPTVTQGPTNTLEVALPLESSDERPATCVGKVVSGGQTGVDRAGLDVAIALGIEHGGWCPKGRRAEDGPIPACYRLSETESDDYAVRTERNVVDSDGTLILYSGVLRGGTQLTYRLAQKHRRPHVLVDLCDPKPVEAVWQWIREQGISVLNVAGPRASQSEDIYALAREYLEQVLAGV